VFDDGFLMVDLWWLGGFSWFVSGMFWSFKFFRLFEIYFGVWCGKRRRPLGEMFERLMVN